MFIRKDNTLKWKWIAYAAFITFALVFMCIFGLDKILFDVINNPSCNINMPDTTNGLCIISLLFGKIFNWKIWLAFSGLAVLWFFLYKGFTNERDFRYAFIKIKNSYGFYILSSIVAVSVITKILKVIIGRARPIFANPTLFNMFSQSHEFHSMPSGHTAVSFAGLVMIGMLFPRIKWLTWALAIIIGLTRIYVGAHWVADVIFGAFLGMVCADFAKALLKKINSK